MTRPFWKPAPYIQIKDKNKRLDTTGPFQRLAALKLQMIKSEFSFSITERVGGPRQQTARQPTYLYDSRANFNESQQALFWHCPCDSMSKPLDCNYNFGAVLAPRHDICPNSYTTGTSCHKFYTTEVRNLRHCSLTINAFKIRNLGVFARIEV